MQDGRDIWFDEAIADADAECPAEELDAEHPLFILYSSGSTAKPKGILHTTGGYLTGVAWTTKNVFDLKPDEDKYWCPADVGWITGHSYIVYGPLLNGITSVMYEGPPDYPDKDAHWDIVEKEGVTIYYFAPTAIRGFMKWGTEYPGKHDLSSLQAARHRRRADQPEGLGLVPQVHRRRALPDRGHLVADRDGAHPRSRRCRALPGPSRARPPGRCRASTPSCSTSPRATRWTRSRACRAAQAVAGDAPHPLPRRRAVQGDVLREVRPRDLSRRRRRRKDKDGYFWVIGRIDDVVNISGHRLSTAEVESPSSRTPRWPRPR